MEDVEVKPVAESETKVVLGVRRIFVRGTLDFALGVGAFLVVSSLLGHAQALAGSAHWRTVVAPSLGSTLPGFTDRNTAVMMLALTSGAIMAFNLAIARHLRSASATERNRISMSSQS